MRDIVISWLPQMYFLALAGTFWKLKEICNVIFEWKWMGISVMLKSLLLIYYDS